MFDLGSMTFDCLYLTVTDGLGVSAVSKFDWSKLCFKWFLSSLASSTWAGPGRGSRPLLVRMVELTWNIDISLNLS